MKKPLLVVIPVLMIAGIALAWMFSFPTVSIRYRLSLEAEVDGRIARGSGVIQVDYARSPKLLPEMQRVEKRVHGEAVVLDLGERGLLFALLAEGQDRRSRPETIVPNAWDHKNDIWDDEELAWIRALKGRVDVPLDKLPMLVRFRDIADPKTVERVDPNNLAKSFGAGARLVRATIEITDDAVTTGIERTLLWLASGYPEKWLVPPGGGPRSVVPSEFLLTYSEFLRGQK